MYLPSLKTQLSRTRTQFAQMTNLKKDQPVYQLISPYRLAPIGAHVDHQGGGVLGMTIDTGTTLVFAPHDEPFLRLQSTHFSDCLRIDLSDTVTPRIDWGRYAQGALFALKQQYEVTRGFSAYLSGSLIGAGLSSSASVGLAYLHALAVVNDLSLSKAELVELDRIIENEFLGLNNGIQDQTTVANGRADALILQDTRQRTVAHVISHPAAADYYWFLAFSGFSRELTSSGFNDRVAECRQAAGLLNPHANILSDIPREQYEQQKQRLPLHLQRRAAHYFTETARVAQGANAWSMGDIEQFGHLMNESCDSSINQYECGSLPLIALQEIALSLPSVVGSRFSGGGYGGCLIGLVHKAGAEDAMQKLLDRYLLTYPDQTNIAGAYLVHPANGLRQVNNYA